MEDPARRTQERERALAVERFHEERQREHEELKTRRPEVARQDEKMGAAIRAYAKEACTDGEIAETLSERLMLHPRSARDFLDALVALGMLERDGDRYANTPETALFLDRAKPPYVGGLLEMANARLYPFWGSLTEALRTGQPQNEAKTGENFFTALYADPARLEGFL